ncbi:nitroreductase family protein [Prauserella oleivorans]
MVGGETDVLARAVVRAPSVGNTQPWALRLPGGEALLYAVAGRGPGDGASAPDVAISCGAAVANVELGMRVLGRDTEIHLLPDHTEPDLLARVRARGPRVPSEVDLHRFSAIARRCSYRYPFLSQPVSDCDRKDLATAAAYDGVQGLLVAGEEQAGVLAEVQACAASYAQATPDDHGEVPLWTSGGEWPHPRAGDVARLGTLGSSLPWAGLVRPGTTVPDPQRLRERLSAETLLVFAAPEDTRIDHLRTGIAMEHAWLAAVDMGLAAAVQTRPLHRPRVRQVLVDRLGITGVPQLLMRVGHPAGYVPWGAYRMPCPLRS